MARQSKFENLKSKFLLAPGFPWRVRFPVQRRRPRDQRRNLKTRCGAENKDQMPDFARADFGGARLSGADEFDGSAERRPTVRRSHPASHWTMSVFAENARPAVCRFR